MVDWLIDWLLIEPNWFDWLINRLNDRLTALLIDYVTNWLIDWLIASLRLTRPTQLQPSSRRKGSKVYKIIYNSPRKPPRRREPHKSSAETFHVKSLLASYLFQRFFSDCFTLWPQTTGWIRVDHSVIIAVSLGLLSWTINRSNQSSNHSVNMTSDSKKSHI